MNANVNFLQVKKKISTGFGPNSRFWCCIFLTLWKTLSASSPVVLSMALWIIKLNV
jgi:hypothetical protein